MNNNDILRRLRYAFDYNDSQMIALFRLNNATVTRAELCSYLKKEDQADYRVCYDELLAAFLNGLIIKNRGKSEGPEPVPEKRLTNNIILIKLKIALELKSEDMMEIMALADFRVSKHELSAFFRKPGHKHFRSCLDQFLRHFLLGIKLRYRDKHQVPVADKTTASSQNISNHKSAGRGVVKSKQGLEKTAPEASPWQKATTTNGAPLVNTNSRSRSQKPGQPSRNTDSSGKSRASETKSIWTKKS